MGLVREGKLCRPSILKEVSIMENNSCLMSANIEEKDGGAVSESTPKTLSQNSKPMFKEKECRVLSYNKNLGVLDIVFDGYGIRLTNVKNFSGNTAMVKYRGEIGKPNFECKI